MSTLETTQIQKTNAPVPTIRFKESDINQIETIAQTYSLANTSTLGRFQQAFAMATGLQKLWNAITEEMMKDICALAGTSLGFKTDRDSGDKGRYSIDIVKECFIEATLRGARPVGNEFNIIASRCYLTKEFYMRSFGELAGVTNVIVSPGMPQPISDGICGVRVALRWKRFGQDESIGGADDKPGRVFAVKYYKQIEADQVIGKALRKAYKAAYEQVTGSVLADDEDHIVDGEVVSPSQPAEQETSRTAALSAKVGAKQPEPKPAPQQEVKPSQPAGTNPGDTDAGAAGEVKQEEKAPAKQEKKAEPERATASVDDFGTPQALEAFFMAAAKFNEISEEQSKVMFGKMKVDHPITKLSKREEIANHLANGSWDFIAGKPV